jgi:membrane-associated phospholipid phosphatase
VPELLPPTTVTAREPGSAWKREVAVRVRAHFGLKVTGISAFMWLFFVGYFHVLRHPAFPVQQMPLTAIDELIPFQPAALWVYVSLWLYIGIPPGLALTLRSLIAYGLWAAALCITGLACFHFWPTAVPAQAVDVARYPAFAVLQGVDAAGNACPSLHVATAMFTAIRLGRQLRDLRVPPALGWLNAAWFVAIAYSTLAIKQHVLIDVLAGALLGAVFAAPALRFRRRR